MTELMIIKFFLGIFAKLKVIEMFIALIIILAVYAVAILLSLVTKEGRLAWRLVCARVKYIFPTTKRAFYENDDITIVFKRILVISIELFCGVMLGLFYVIVSFVIPVMPYIYMLVSSNVKAHTSFLLRNICLSVFISG